MTHDKPLYLVVSTHRLVRHVHHNRASLITIVPCEAAGAVEAIKTVARAKPHEVVQRSPQLRQITTVT